MSWAITESAVFWVPSPFADRYMVRVSTSNLKANSTNCRILPAALNAASDSMVDAGGGGGTVGLGY